MTAHLENRRQDVRLPAHFEVEHILSETNHCTCELNEVSASGLSLTLKEGSDWGEPHFAWLEFKLPGDDGPAIRALGELRHEENGCRGFKFKYLNPHARRRYNNFLMRLGA